MTTQKRKRKSLIPGYTLIPEGEHYKIRKISLSKERIKTDPAFHNTRRANKEFVHVSEVVKLIRSAFLVTSGIKSHNGPLTKILMEALRQDDVNILGRRNIMHASLQQLEGYDFNKKSLIKEVLKIECPVNYNEHTQEVQIKIPSLNPAYAINAPQWATHCRIYAILASISPENMQVDTKTFHTEYLPLKAIQTRERQKTYPLQSNLYPLHMIAIGIQWFRSFNSFTISSDKKITGPLAITKVCKTNI